MGDGTAQSSGLRICTDSFEIKDVVRLMNVLMIKYRINCGLHTHKGTYRIYITKDSMPELRRIIKPHMINSMLYKLNI